MEKAFPTEDLILGEIQQIKEGARQTQEKLDRVIELLSAMNKNLTSIKSNTAARGGGIMGGR